MNTVKIKGMSCQHCVASVKKALEALPGVSNVTVDLDNNQATFEGNPDAVAVEKAITSIGFEVIR